MQISDMLGQYNRNVTNGAEELRGAQGVQKLVSSAGDLSAGSIFEGTVNKIKNGKVTLALGNGQTITARLDGKVDIKPGSSMFFQVKANDGATVEIRPYMGAGNTSNPILLNALTAAQVPVTERTLMMVDSMMREQMPVDRQSILDMVRILGNNPGTNVQTIVQMTKLGLPVNAEMAAQYENYLSDQHAMLGKLELVIGQMTEILGDGSFTAEESAQLFGKLMDVLLAEGLPEGAQGQAYENAAQMPGAGKESGAAQMPENAINHGNEIGASDMPLGGVLSEEQLAALTKSLQNVPALVGNEALFAGVPPEEIYVDTMQEDAAEIPELLRTPQETLTEGGALMAEEAALKKDMPVSEFLRTLQEAIIENSQYGHAGIRKLFAGKAFQTLLKHVAEQQWLIKPEDLKEDGKLGRLYGKMEQQLIQMEAVMKAAGVTQNSFLQTAADVRDNIEFMNQMNQIYHYVQMPLKLSGQKANGELYVYSSRRQLNDPDAELTAFLHLDMENLGATDVSVRMKDRQVKTNFYLAEDASYDLVEKHLLILEKRLKKKGYSCAITVTNEKKNINFKENFVNRGRMSSGSLHRYSFDVRA